MNEYDEPLGHGEVSFDDVRVPKDNILLGEGRAFEIAQGRLGPGRVHHCMRLIGQAEVALELAIKRGLSRTAFGKPIVNLGGNRERIADARIAIDQARLLVLNAAWKLDAGGPLNALSEVSQIKVVVPNMAQQVIDMAMQLHGGGGLSADFPLAGHVDQRPRAAAGRRARRGAPRRRRPARDREAPHERRPGRPAAPPGLGGGACARRAFRARGDEVLAADIVRRRRATSHLDVALRRRLGRGAATGSSEHWGGLDVLVNNAGVAGGGRIDVAGMDEWQWITEINLFGVVRGTRTFVPMFKQQRSGHIVNIASLAGLVHPAGMGSYNAVKAGVVAFTETCAPRARGVRTCAARWCARRTSGPT